MNDSEQSLFHYCDQFKKSPRTEIHLTLHKKCMITIRVLFSYSHEFNKLPHALTFIAHCIRNK